MEITDVMTYTPIIVLTGMLIWFSNKEMRKSSKLGHLVEKKTEELKNVRLTRINELAKAAEFGRLSQGLFHDLITPLTSLALHTEETKNTKVVEASQRMTAYIKDIRSTLAQEEVDRQCILKEELENVLHLLAYTIRNSGIHIHIEDSGRTWYGNPIKIRQIFLNLISNAIDSFGEKDRHRDITIRIRGGELTVEDTGSGIAPENLDKIFEPFYTTKSPEKGTGIGLATVKSIVEKDLKGKIKVESQLGVGTLFTITF